MGSKCNICAKLENLLYTMLLKKPEGKQLLGKSRHRWTLTSLAGRGCAGVDWIQMLRIRSSGLFL